MAMAYGSLSVLSVFLRKEQRLIAIVEPKAVRQTTENTVSGVVRGIDNKTCNETMYTVEVKNGGKTDMFFVPQHSIRSLLVIDKKPVEVPTDEDGNPLGPEVFDGDAIDDSGAQDSGGQAVPGFEEVK